MITIIDFGGQYCHLIARKIRELGVYSEIVLNDVSAEKIKKLNPDGIILSGGPASVTKKDSPALDGNILCLGIPILGICYGHQLIAKMSQGVVSSKQVKEYGKNELRIIKKNRLLSGLKNKEQVWMSHGDTIMKLPTCFDVVASTKTCKIASFENNALKLYGVQFHPEVVHTPHGEKVLRNFLKICNAKKDWNIKDRKKIIIKELKHKINDDAVIVGVSGGVDSLVASSLLRQATNKLYCVFVDHGLCRKYEAEYAKKLYSDIKIKNFYIVDAQELFLSRLKGISDPEEKRRIIGRTFIEVFENKVKKLKKKHGKIEYLGQGTIYPDRIESAQASKKAAIIKTHHNVGGLPEKMNLKLVEPLKDFYKDEVRILGKELGLKKEWLWRHPFPGPGLAIRIVGAIDDNKLRIVREADYIFIEELKKSGQYYKIWQALAALLPIKTVGVMGDERTYDYMISLRAVTSRDAMTADWARIPEEVLDRISTRIVNEVPGVNRVVYDITQKPPATIEYE